MNPRSTWFWILTAATLLGVILVARRFSQPAPTGPQRIFTRLQPSAVGSISVRPAGELEIRADRTNGTWRLITPLAYPAQELKIGKLLQSLASLRPATQISVDELRTRPRAKEDYGFDPPQASIVIREGDLRTDILVGALTAPGDQLFVQRVGDETLYVVDAELLHHIPRSANDWRDTGFVQVDIQTVNRLTVTNQGKVFALQRASNGAPWRLTVPMPARANDQKIQQALQSLLGLSVQEFVSDNPGDELESFGLQPARLEIGLWNGTNRLARLQFGSSPTNHTDRVFARNLSQGSVVSVPLDPLSAWSDTVNEYRDPFLVGATPEPQLVEVRADETFTLERRGEQKWQVMPGNFPADAVLVKQCLSGLAGMRIVSYVKDVVTPPDLPAFGLAAPRREYALKSGPGTNTILAQVSFGTNQEDRVFARRADENSVYTVKLAELARLPATGWGLRERKLWDISPDQVTRVTMQQGNATRQMIRKGSHDWALAPGSQGFINELAVEETVRGVCQLAVAAWAGRGEELRSRLGFVEKPRKLIVELASGDPLIVEFGGEAPSTFPYAGVTFDQQLWAFEFPWPLYRDIVTYLGFPVEKP